MKKNTCVMLSAIALILVNSFTSSSALFAQTWTSVDGGGTNGINSATAVRALKPSCAVYNNELYAIWTEATTGPNQVHIKKYNGTSWVAAGNTSGQSQLNVSVSPASNPKIVTCNGYLYAAWQEDDVAGPNISAIHVKRYNGTTWVFVQDYAIPRPYADINYSPTTDASNVDLVVYNNEVYASWIEWVNGDYTNQLRVSKFNGTTWSSVDGNGGYGLNYDHLYGAYPPKLCVHNNKLYIAWTENNASNISQLRVKAYNDDGSTWSFIDGGTATGINYSSGIAAQASITMGSYNGNLYVLWYEPDYIHPDWGATIQLRVKKYNGSVWSFADGGAATGWNKDITEGSGAANPTVMMYNNLMYAAWHENEVPDPWTTQIRVIKYDDTTKTFIDGNGVTGINQNTAQNAESPILIEYNGEMYAIWHEDNNGTNAYQIRAKKYPLPGMITSVTVPANSTYKVSTNLDFTVNFNKIENVVGGTPYIPITLNTGGIVNANYLSGSGTKSLIFRYVVTSGNEDNDGITVGSGILLPGGCTLMDATSISASPNLNNLGSTANVLVDAVAPSITSVNSNTINGIYKAGDVIAITITFSEAATVTGIPTLTLNSGGTAYYASGSGTTTLTFNYTIASGHNSSDLDYSTINSLNLSGGAIKDAIGNDAILILPTVGGINSLGGQKNFVIDAVVPTISSVGVPGNATYVAGQNLDFTVNFNEAITVVTAGGTPYISITLNTGGTVNAVYQSGSGTSVLVFRYTIVSGNADNNGIAVGPTISANGGTLKDIAGNNITLTLNNIGSTTGILVDGIAPMISSVSVPANGTYIAGQNLDFTLNFNEVVFVETTGGTPFIQVTLNVGGTVYAVYQSGSGTTVLVFRYIIVSGNKDDNGIYVGSVVTFNGGKIADAAGNNASSVLSNIGTTAGVLVDAVSPGVTLLSTSADTTNASPIPVNITFTKSVTGFDAGDITVTNGTKGTLTGSGTTYNIDITPLSQGIVTINVSAGVAQDAVGNVNTSATQLSRLFDSESPITTISSIAGEPTNVSPIPVTIAFSESMTGFVVGDIIVTNGTAGSFSGSGTTYTANITPSGQGSVIVEVAAGVTQDAAGNINSVAISLTRTYDNISPAVLSVSSLTNDGAYKAGDIITITISFSESLIVTGTPKLALSSGGVASYVSGSGSATLAFSYTVASGNSTADLDYLTTSSLSLSGGTIKDEAKNAAILTLPAVGGINSLGGQKNILIGILPIVTSQAVSEILPSTATGNWNITNLGFPNPIAHGVCWNKTGAPTISDSKVDNGAASATGAFAASIAGLATGTTFYVRSFVTNILGTSYGDEVSFTTNGMITYNLNGGINNVANAATYVYGVGLTLSNPNRTNYTFGGWYENETFIGTAVTAISVTTKGDIILYAKWSPISGINNASSADIILYPNPTRNVVFIPGAKGTVSIYDINGHLALMEKIAENGSVSTSMLANGVYIVKVNGKDYKLIKE